MRPLRLAVDARVVAGDPRGIGRYARAILRRFVRRDDVELTLLEFGPFAFRRRRGLASALDSSRFAVRAHARGGYDAVWHPANGTFFPSKAPNVVTIHDAVPFLEPDPDPKRRVREQEPFLRSARTAARVITDSAFARDQLYALLGIARDRVEVVPLGVDRWFSPGEAAPLPAGLRAGTYLLFVGPIREPRKNFATFYEAFGRAFGTGGPKLAILGPDAPESAAVVHVPRASDDELRALYRGAIALAIPASYEAFGLPLLEAMACGTPVVASHASALPEIGGDAAIYAGAFDVGAWSDALAAVSGDPVLRARAHVAGLERAQHYDWDACANRLFAIFSEVASR